VFRYLKCLRQFTGNNSTLALALLTMALRWFWSELIRIFFIYQEKAIDDYADEDGFYTVSTDG